MLRIIVGDSQGKGTPLGAAEDIRAGVLVEELLALATTGVLFGEPRTFRGEDLLRDEQTGDALLEIADVLAASMHQFVLEESEMLLKAARERLTEVGAEVVVYEKPKSERRFDEFGVTAAFAAGDKKKLWLALQLALEAGEKPEAVAGLLLWKARDLLGKASVAARPKLRGQARTLLSLYHDSHRGAGDLALLLEKFALSL